MAESGDGRSGRPPAGDDLLWEARPGDVGDYTPANPRLVVDTWLGVPENAGWRVLMLRRTEAHGGFWQGVSGRVDSDDTSLGAAALREIREETGLGDGVKLIDLGRWIEFVSPFTGRSYRKRSLGAIFPAGTRPEDVVFSEEHDEARLVSFEEARALVRWDLNVEELIALEAALRDL